MPSTCAQHVLTGSRKECYRCRDGRCLGAVGPLRTTLIRREANMRTEADLLPAPLLSLSSESNSWIGPLCRPATLMAEVVVRDQDAYFVVAGAGVQRGALVTPDAAVTFRGRASFVTWMHCSGDLNPYAHCSLLHAQFIDARRAFLCRWTCSTIYIKTGYQQQCTLS